MLKPPIKWLGGKTQIINEIITRFPQTMNNYHEIFLGGGSVLLALLYKSAQKDIIIKKSIYAYDGNVKLIEMWQNIKEFPEKLYLETQKHVERYNSCGSEPINRKVETLSDALGAKETYYYYVRRKYNKFLYDDTYDSIKMSAMFIFLNKTCFRGMHRVGPNGFNVPYGNYKSPEIINKNHINELSIAISNVNFIHLDYKKSLKLPKYKDFVYLDPPYVPISKTSFVGYSLDGFTKKHHDKLFALCIDLFNNSIKFLMSNADSIIIEEYFDSEDFTIEKIQCKRSINSKKPQSSIYELLVSG